MGKPDLLSDVSQASKKRFMDAALTRGSEIDGRAHATWGVWGAGVSPPAAGGHGSEHLFVWAYRFCASWLRPQRRLEWLDPDLMGFEGLEYETYATGGVWGAEPPSRRRPR